MKIYHKHLKSKGWSDAEIKHTKKIISHIEKTSHPHNKLLLDTIYLGIILVLSILMIGLAFLIIPLLVATPAILLYPILLIIALSFGILLTHIIKDLSHLKFHHHAIITIIIPLMGIISFSTVVEQTNKLKYLGGLVHNQWLIGIIFTMAFLAPYLYYLWRLK